ncbi:MAG: sulfatase [Woeseiaceae bacterium]|nr:sulfatase [Woeseiaceae bacterium]
MFRVLRLATIAALILANPAGAAPPNVILVLADDLGYGDIGANGNRRIATPNIDRMAREGVRLTGFYASANVCTPSRAGLLTGRYAIRSGLGHKVVESGDTHGLPAGELTLAEMLQDVGYYTALVGKWHLGHTPAHWPTRHGFDTFYGLPYSNDMRPLALYRGDSKIEEPVTQETLTERYTTEVIRQIELAGDQPFFIFLSHTFPHIPLYVSDRFSGRSKAGLYGDVVETIDWSMGRILETLEEQHLDDNTLVIFTSDNGAWFEGDNGPYREGKGSTWEGGYRVPFVARWPGRLPAGRVSGELSMNIDLLPTIAALAGSDLPEDLKLDGHNIWPLLNGAQSPHDVIYFFDDENIAALRTPRWKLMVLSYYRRNIAAFERFEPGLGFNNWLLFDMHDPRPGRYSLARENPAVLADMLALLAAGRQQFEPLRTQPPPSVLP